MIPKLLNINYSLLIIYIIYYKTKMTQDNSKRTRCLIYTRVMGYLSPTSRYNIWKRSEFYSRKYFSKTKAANHEFTAQYGCGCNNMEISTDTNLIKNANPQAVYQEEKDF